MKERRLRPHRRHHGRRGKDRWLHVRRRHRGRRPAERHRKRSRPSSRSSASPVNGVPGMDRHEPLAAQRGGAAKRDQGRTPRSKRGGSRAAKTRWGASESPKTSPTRSRFSSRNAPTTSPASRSTSTADGSKDSGRGSTLACGARSRSSAAAARHRQGDRRSAFSRKSAAVAVCARDAARLDEAVFKLGRAGNVFGAVADVAEPEQVLTAFVDAARERLGRIDYPGQQRRRARARHRRHDDRSDVLLRQLREKLFGLFSMTRAVRTGRCARTATAASSTSSGRRRAIRTPTTFLRG